MKIVTKYNIDQAVWYLKNGTPHTGNIANIVILKSKNKLGYSIAYSVTGTAFTGLYDQGALFESEEKLLDNYNIILIKMPANK